MINRRSFILTGLSAAGTLGARRACRPRPGQAARRRDRRRRRRRDRREIHRQGQRRRDRRDAGRAENETYQTCFHSNLYLGGFRTTTTIIHRYDDAGEEPRHHAGPRPRHADRPRQEGGRARRRPAPALRPARGLARHRPEIRFRSGLVAGGRGDDAAWLEAGPRRRSCSSSGSTRCPNGGDDRDDRAAQSLSLPARPL